MFGRVFAIAMNTYREAVRARVLLGLLALALATSAYSLVIATMAVRQETRIIADIGAASMSLYAILVAIVLGATSLYRELELKTVFPILTRRLRRHEYLLGKYFGILGVILAFLAVDGATVFAMLAIQSEKMAPRAILASVALLAILAVGLWRAKYSRVFLVLPWSLVALAVLAIVSGDANGERQVVLASMALTMAEVAIVVGLAMLFSSFSSPFLTAIFTIMMFLIGRSSDTLANLPAKYFGETIRNVGIVLAKIVPNLNIYVPARPLLLGQVVNVSVAQYVSTAWMNAILYAAVLLTLSAIVFRRRDFQ